ncbi:MAG: alkaline phosphatase family protein [Terriglobales bacterium]
MPAKMKRAASFVLMAVSLVAVGGAATAPTSDPRPKVMVVSVNGAEWDIIRPLLLRGEMPNLASVMKRGVSGKLRTITAPNCPKVYSILETSTPPMENGITGFTVQGRTADTSMLKATPLWSILSSHGVSVGMANVPATFPVKPVNGYMISGMLTRGKNCEDGVLCSPKLAEVSGEAVYPRSLGPELLSKVGDVPLDCSRMPDAKSLSGHEAAVVEEWLAGVSEIRQQQTRLFDYLLSHHPTDFTFFTQSCEDRVGHWLYPIQPYNVGYNPRIHTLRVDAFPSQYREFDRVLGVILSHLDANTTLFILSDHGIKPLREHAPAAGHQHGGGTPIIAHHNFEDGDDVPGIFVAAGPEIKKGVAMMGFDVSVFDIAPTILRIYGIPAPGQMKGRVLTEIFR